MSCAIEKLFTDILRGRTPAQESWHCLAWLGCVGGTSAHMAKANGRNLDGSSMQGGEAHATAIHRGLSKKMVQHLDKYFRMKAKHLATIGCLQAQRLICKARFSHSQACTWMGRNRIVLVSTANSSGQDRKVHAVPVSPVRKGSLQQHSYALQEL